MYFLNNGLKPPPKIYNYDKNDIFCFVIKDYYGDKHTDKQSFSTRYAYEDSVVYANVLASFLYYIIVELKMVVKKLQKKKNVTKSVDDGLVTTLSGHCVFLWTAIFLLMVTQ